MVRHAPPVERDPALEIEAGHCPGSTGRVGIAEVNELTEGGANAQVGHRPRLGVARFERGVGNSY